VVRVRNTAATTTHQFSNVECNRMDSAVDRHQMALQSPPLPSRATDLESTDETAPQRLRAGVDRRRRLGIARPRINARIDI